jgi:hypothetical protein
MRVACGSHALRIRFDCGLLTFPAGRCSFLCGFGTLGACCSPGIVLCPVMDLISTFPPIQKSDLGKSTHEFSGVAGPLSGDPDVLAAHTCKIACRTVLGDPEEKLDQRPASLSAEPALDFYRLRVARQRRRDSGVVSHRLDAFLSPGRTGTREIGPPVENSTPPNSRKVRYRPHGAQCS